ncbi:uncharacterized protein LOC120837624 [Ixodes scapularis]|uniref:uncharacterized protein LOC120837624 n=1 Tax=Ixodes scapularis TaxID=6945 RepID=UPI001C380216|nr:uncharacterized protein LOC120837624 [Ixodes scapularis]
MSQTRTAGLKGRLYNFIAAFLEGRCFQVQVDQATSATRANKVGVPQGSVISPTLFNLAMHTLPHRLDAVPGLGHTIYADDITLWATDGSIGQQEDILQNSLNIIYSFASEIGLSTSPEKTEYLVIHGGRSTPSKRAEKNMYNLSIGDQPITRKSAIRILGMYLDENCTANTWFQKTTGSVKKILHVLRRISTRTRGVHEREMRRFVQAFVVSRLLYGLPYHPVNRTQMLALERLINEARRLITGLPRYTRLDALKSCGGINDLSELVSAHYNIQEARLRTTPAGRSILAKLGYAVHDLPELPQQTPPWEHTILTDGTPLPQRIQSTGRRLPLKRRHLKYIRSLDDCTPVIYVDASLPADHKCAVYATAWYDCNTEAQARYLHTTATPPLSTQAELQAITDYARDALLTAKEDAPVTHIIYTDSQAAHHICSDTKYTGPTLHELKVAVSSLRASGHQFIIRWVPAYCGIPGNEKAHRLARAHLLSALAKGPSSSSSLGNPSQEIANPWHDLRSTKAQRATYLSMAANPLSIPKIPSQHFSRREAVMIRQIQTGTLLTPHLLQRFRGNDGAGPSTASGICKNCNSKADLVHLMWSCPLYNIPRQQALDLITNAPVPASLNAWACPDTTISPKQALELWEALLTFIKDPTAPPVGDRLFPATAKRIRPPPPSSTKALKP